MVDAIQSPEPARSRFGCPRPARSRPAQRQPTRGSAASRLASSGLIRAEKPTRGVVHVEHAGVVAVGELFGLAGHRRLGRPAVEGHDVLIGNGVGHGHHQRTVGAGGRRLRHARHGKAHDHRRERHARRCRYQRCQNPACGAHPTPRVVVTSPRIATLHRESGHTTGRAGARSPGPPRWCQASSTREWSPSIRRVARGVAPVRSTSTCLPTSESMMPRARR